MNASEPEKKPRTLRTLILGVVLAGIVATAWILYSRYTAVDYRALNDGEWQVAQLGSPYIQFESPVTLVDKSRPPLGREQDLLRRHQSFLYEKGFDLYVLATVLDYHQHVFVDPNSPLEAVKNFDKIYGASDITYEPYQLIIGTYKATRIDGSFTKQGKKYIFSRVTCEYRNNFRDLLVIVRADDMEALLVRNRIAATIRFEPL